MKQHKLLVVNHKPEMKTYLVNTLRMDYDVKGVSNGMEALEMIRKEHFDMVVADIQLPEIVWERLIADVNELNLDIMILAVTAGGSIDDARKILQLGVYDYITEPFELEKLKLTIKNGLAAHDLRKENKVLHIQLEESSKVRSIIGNSLPLRRIRDRIRQVASTKAALLIAGPSGTGKKLVAREIHAFSDRRNQPYITVNCASIPETLLDSELFGHEKGVFESAHKRRSGKFELASHGTILLEEIGEMSAAIQAKLLRVIQEGEFDRVGGEDPIKTDVRIIATTSRNLREEIQRGYFREDLFLRLNVVPMELPPLRERREDIPLLVDHFINLYSSENNREPIKLTPAALEKLRNAQWSGNIRELENQIHKAVIIASGATLDAAFFQLDDKREEQLARMEQVFRHGSVRDMEKLMILCRLGDLKENRTKAAKSLDISVRTLRNKLHEYNVPNKSKTASVEAYDFAIR